MTSWRSRKVAELWADARLALAYQLDWHGAYVTLEGTARLDDDPDAKAARWSRGLTRWFPGGPADPEVAMIRLRAQRIELWSYRHRIMPQPRGHHAAVLERAGDGWALSST